MFQNEHIYVRSNVVEQRLNGYVTSATIFRVILMGLIPYVRTRSSPPRLLSIYPIIKPCFTNLARVRKSIISIHSHAPILLIIIQLYRS